MTGRASSLAPGRVVLGTAQLGMAYGVTNARGALGPEDAQQIVETALARGVERFDTAPSYGVSEAVLGECLRGRGLVITKTPSFSGEESLGPAHAAAVRASAERSIERFGGGPLHCLLVHHAPDLWKPGAHHVVDALQALLDGGSVTHVGVSVYEPSDVPPAMEALQPSVVQLPLSVLDQRFVAAIADLEREGVEVHARSVFLQGLLLDATALPPALLGVAAPLAERLARLDAIGPRLATCLSFVADQLPGGRLLVGVTGSDELAGILDAAAALPDREAVNWETLAMDGPLIDPRRWT